MPTTADKRATFRKLHASGCFVIPNPWDIGTVKYLQSMGFKALATARALPGRAGTPTAPLRAMRCSPTSPSCRRRPTCL